MAKANAKYEEKLAAIVKRLPSKPGVYQYFDENGKIIYVGKAKSLKNRVSTYFNRDMQHGAKISLLVRKIANIEVVVVQSEIDALLLENNLIKKYQPRYNVLMKDDKTYPWICLKNEPFPRVFSTRHIIRDGSQYFGPYASGKMMHTVLDLIRQLFPLRTCKLSLNEANIKAGRFDICLEHHIGKCNAPCVGKETEEKYGEYIKEVKDILKGNIHRVKKNLKEVMMRYAEAMEFEKAQAVKEKIDLLERYQSKSIVVSTTVKDVDVFSLISDENEAFVNYLKVVNGAVIQAHSVELKKRLEENDEDILLHAILDIRKRFYSNSKEVIIPFALSVELPDVHFTIPQRSF